MKKPRKLVLDAGLREVTGCGNSVTFTISAWRTNAAGNHERYELELRACRHSVRAMLREIRKMHLRDRERLASEHARIEREVRELTTEQPL